MEIFSKDMFEFWVVGIICGDKGAEESKVDWGNLVS